MGMFSSFTGSSQAKDARRAANRSAQAQTDVAKRKEMMLRDFFNQTRQDYAGQRETGTQSMNQLMALMGMGEGDSQQAAEDAFQRFRGSTGYEFRQQEGDDSVRSLAAASGMLGSGDMYKALLGRSQDLASQEFGNYSGQLNQLMSLLPGANNALAQAGGQYAGGIGNAMQGGADATSSMHQQIGAANIAHGNQLGQLTGMALGGLGSAFGGPLAGVVTSNLLGGGTTSGNYDMGNVSGYSWG